MTRHRPHWVEELARRAERRLPSKIAEALVAVADSASRLRPPGTEAGVHDLALDRALEDLHRAITTRAEPA